MKFASKIGNVGSSSFRLHFWMNLSSCWRVGDWKVGKLMFVCCAFQGVVVGMIFSGIGSFLKRPLSPGIIDGPIFSQVSILNILQFSGLDHSCVVIFLSESSQN